MQVLVLEDSPEFSLLIKRWLAASGIRTDHAPDLPEAQHLLATNAYDAVLCDIELPSGSSFAFIEAARHKLPYAAIVVMTSQQRADYAVQALRLKVDDLLFKPFTEEQLLGKLAELHRQRNAMRQSVLAIGAHPDDVELGCGASLCAHVARGDRVHILTLSGGEAGGVANERAEESLRAAKLLGATLTIASLTDTQIGEGADTIRVIGQCIESCQPQLIYTHSEKDGHQDHRNVFRATLVAARQVPGLLCYQAPSATAHFVPTRFNEISQFLPAKIEAIAAYGSQASIRPYMHPDLIEATARYWGRFANYGLCEAFEVIRERAS